MYVQKICALRKNPLFAMLIEALQSYNLLISVSEKFAIDRKARKNYKYMTVVFDRIVYSYILM